MKIIVTEEQYKQIETYINEARLDKDIMFNLGKKVLEIYDSIGQGKSTKFDMETGNSFILNCIEADGGKKNFRFKIVEDSSKILKSFDFITLSLSYDSEDDEISAYLTNKNVISTQDNGNTFNLRFGAEKNTGIKTSLTVSKISSVEESEIQPQPTQPAPQPTNVTPQPAPQPANVTPQPAPQILQPSNSGTTGDTLQSDGKIALDLILNDPDLKKAFYSQPSLFNRFVAELKGTEDAGTGIVPTLQILNKYYINKIGGEFIEDKKVSFKLLERVEATFSQYRKKKTYTFETNEIYHPTVMKNNFGKNPKLRAIGEDKLEPNLSYEIVILERLNNVSDGFLCTLISILNQTR